MAVSGPREPIIELRAVHKSFRSAAGDFTALKGISFTVRPGEFVAIIGKSGSGKSTLLNMITGIDRPTSGEVFVDGVGLHTLDEARLARGEVVQVELVHQRVAEWLSPPCSGRTGSQPPPTAMAAF